MSSKPIIPLITGIVFIAGSFLDKIIEVDTQALAIIINLIVIVAIRIITLLMIDNYCDRYKIKKIWWMIFGFIFAGWTLFIFSIALFERSGVNEEEY